MIIDRANSHFIFILPWDHVRRHYNYVRYNGKELTNEEYLEHWGKWVFLGSRDQFDQLGKKIDPYVEHKIIPAAKYDRKEIAEFDLGECVMCVYCDERQKEDVWNILASLGVEDKAWVFERETLERWLPGGHLLESWIKGKGMSKEQAEKVRRDAKATFKRMFGNKYAIFQPVNQ